MTDLVIRPASAVDAQALLEIYSWYVRNTAVSFSWEPPALSEFLSQMKDVMRKYPYLVAERGGDILGYSYAHPFVSRRSYDWSAEVTIYLAPNARRQGIGRALYAVLEDALRRMGVQNLYACIGWTDEEDEYLTHASPDFHTRMGYRRVGMFRKCGRKFERWYDMIWMEKVIGQHEERPAPFTAWEG